MKNQDKIKTYIGFGLVIIVMTSFGVLGKNHTVTRWLAASSIVGWMIAMYWINHQKKKEKPHPPNDEQGSNPNIK